MLALSARREQPKEAMISVAPPPDGPDEETVPANIAAAKQALRLDIIERRRTRPRGLHAVTATALRRHVLARVAELGARTVACLVPQATEPGSPVLLDALHVAGVRILLPVLAIDLDLDWAVFTGRSALVAGRHGLFEPSGPPLGLDAVRRADVVLVPALAVDRAGHRLGRGGGSYDRALARVRSAVPVAALLFDDELLDHVPVTDHDRNVSHVITPSGGWRPVDPDPTPGPA